MWLVLSSLFFYAHWNVIYLPLILMSMLFNFALGTWLAGGAAPSGHMRARISPKLVLTFGIAANIIALGYFKYANFFIENINAVTGWGVALLNIMLPLAISFFTFQQIAYLVDSYRGLTRDYDILTYMLFVVFFPQLIAGPIVSHGEMIPQFMRLRNFVRNHRNLFLGAMIFVIGLFKKVVVADTFAQYATYGFDVAKSLTMIGGWFSSLSYTMQIYFDFSGYCDMAIGVALLFNIVLPINFNSPYKALNIQDFWRRWHITLSRFLRDHIYIPLGGNHRGARRTYINLFMVFLIGGFWHGAAWTFVIWGCLHGLANVVHKAWQKMGRKMSRILAWFITFNFVNIAWIFFRANSFDSAFKVLRAMFDVRSLTTLHAFKSKYYLAGFGVKGWMLIVLLALLGICLVMPNSVDIMRRTVVRTRRAAILWGMFLGLIAAVTIIKMTVVPYNEFIYFNF